MCIYNLRVHWLENEGTFVKRKKNLLLSDHVSSKLCQSNYHGRALELVLFNNKSIDCVRTDITKNDTTS